ncbi:MAG: helix-turn-helix domain-containing protein [Anaerovoracaceae bacterium]
MNNEKIGSLILTLRTEKGMTQKQLADVLAISDKTVSKWERGAGCPDIALLRTLCEFFAVDMEKVLDGELAENDFTGGNMKKSKFYVCPVCGNVTVTTGEASIRCCGRKLESLEPVRLGKGKSADSGLPAPLQVEKIEDEWYLTSSHPMEKDNYISFVAFLTGDRLQLVKQYPEWNLQVRIPARGHGMLLWYSTGEGKLYSQLI